MLGFAQSDSAWMLASPRLREQDGAEQLIAGLFRPMGGAFPAGDRQPRDAVAGAVAQLRLIA
jgi:hypothetical protein